MPIVYRKNNDKIIIYHSSMYKRVSYQGMTSYSGKYVAPVDQYMKDKKTYTLNPTVASDLYTFATNYELSRSIPLEQYKTGTPNKIDPKRDEFGTDGSIFYGMYGDPQSF